MSGTLPSSGEGSSPSCARSHALSFAASAPPGSSPRLVALRGRKTAMNASAPRVDRVQDTARWVAMARAQESERKDALFKDPFARKLAGPVGAELVRQLSGRAGGTWP